ncbi:MAG: hypothetical protein AAF628_30235 [Planctomycetota bacterium]
MRDPGTFRTWVDLYFGDRPLDDYAEFKAAVDGYERAVRIGVIDERALGAVVELAISDRATARKLGADMLGELAAVSTMAYAAARRLQQSPQAEVRLNALLCLGRAQESGEALFEVLQQALQDRSGRVRRAAAALAIHRGAQALEPQLRDAARAERRDAVRATMLQTADLLGQGWALSDAPGGGHILSVTFERGVLQRRLPAGASQAEIDRAIEELRSDGS